jgi:hypothetical protein
LTIAPSNTWFSVASSSDGTKLVAVAGGPSGSGPIYVSTDSGSTWVQPAAPNGAWYSCASSASGNKLVAAMFGGLIYSWEYRPTLHIGYNTNVLVSWIAALSDYALEQNHDLTTTNWTALTNVPVFTATNSLNIVTLPPSGSNSFFRLKAQ